MTASTLEELFEEELKDIYSAEQQLTEALPKIADAAENEELASAIKHHLEQTKKQIERIERVMELCDIGEEEENECEAMEGLIAEGEELMDEVDEGPVLDCALIAASQKVEHYEIATYGTLVEWAKIMGQDEAASLLEENLNEEKETDRLLTGMAQTMLNQEAMQVRASA